MVVLAAELAGCKRCRSDVLPTAAAPSTADIRHRRRQQRSGPGLCRRGRHTLWRGLRNDADWGGYLSEGWPRVLYYVA